MSHSEHQMGLGKLWKRILPFISVMQTSASTGMQLGKAAALELAKQSTDQHEGSRSLHSIAGAVLITQWYY